MRISSKINHYNSKQKAKYNSAKANFTNAKSFIMAEISKCNGNDNKLSFVDSLNASVSYFHSVFKHFYVFFNIFT